MGLGGTRRAALAVGAAVFLAPALVSAPPADARDLGGVPANLFDEVASPNFVVHYTTAQGDPSAITPMAAHQLLQTAERVLGDSKARLGFPNPLDDGDGRADIYVFPMSGRGERGMVRADSRADQTTGWIGVPPDATGDQVTVAHQVVHLQQLAVYRPAGSVLAEGSATWAPFHMYAPELGRLPDDAQFFPEDPLDCTDASACSRPGHNAWPFFELLAERFGPQIVRELYDRSRALGQADHRSHFREATDAAVVARGTTLPAVFAEFTASNLTGGYALQGLSRRRYGATEPFDDLATGNRARRFRERAVTLDHLSAAFYRLRSGTDTLGAGTRRRCTRARLRVRVDGPEDLEAPLYWAPFRPSRGRARPIELRYGRGHFDVSWSTCGGREIGVALHNPSATLDDRTFSLHVRLLVPRPRPRR